MHFLLMILLFLAPPQEPSVFAPQFRQVNPAAAIFRTIYEGAVTNELTLSVALADPPRNYEVPPESRYWASDALLGVFLRDASGRISTITVMRNPATECDVQVEHADLNSIVLSRTQSDYGILAPSMKIFL